MSSSQHLGVNAFVLLVTEFDTSMKGGFFGGYRTQQSRCGLELRKSPRSCPEQEDFSALDVPVLLRSSRRCQAGPWLREVAEPEHVWLFTTLDLDVLEHG